MLTNCLSGGGRRLSYVFLHKQWRSEVGSRRRAWPQSIKDRILKLVDLKVPRKQISERTGVPYHTINLWSHKRRKASLSSPGFHSLAVKDEIATVTVKDFKSEISVKTPKGFEITGLSSTEFSELIRCLGGLRAL